MKWQAKDMKEVIAKRKEFRAKTIVRQKFRKNKTEGEDYPQIKPEILLKKTEFTLEDKEEIIKYIEKKCRIYFHQLFSINQFQLITVKQETILEDMYDPLIKSYYLISGRLTVNFFTSLLTQNLDEEKGSSNKVIINQESGIGWVFGNQNYSKAVLSAQNGLILQINHKNQKSFDLIQKNCLMTNRQRQLFIKKFKIFSSIQNVNKFFLPYFITRTYTKGQYIYMINDESKDIFLVIQGIVAFQSLVNKEYSDEAMNIRRGPLFLNRNRKDKILLVTETVCKNNYFGEEEIIAEINRQQNAKCASIQCSVLVIPQQRLERLLTFPQFRRNLQLSSQFKQNAREHQISLYLSVNSNSNNESQTTNPQNQQQFQRIKSVIFNQLSDQEQKNQLRTKYSNDKKKIVHNHSVNLPHQSKNKPKILNFSMLNVNKSMYEKTLLRFRYNLKELEKAALPKQKSFQNRGRSLQQIWKTLKLEKSFNPQQQRIVLQEDDGLTYYNTHQRLSKQIKVSRCFRPKSLIYTNKLKTQYIEYLQMIL